MSIKGMCPLKISSITTYTVKPIIWHQSLTPRPKEIYLMKKKRKLYFTAKTYIPNTD